MAKPTCPKCSATEFSMKEVGGPVRGTGPYFELCYCTACGHIVGSGFSWVEVISIVNPVDINQ
jgi:hypothetical protein